MLAALRGARSRAAGAPRVAVGSGLRVGSVPAQQPLCLPKLEGPEVDDPTSLAILAETEAVGGKRRCRHRALLLRVPAEPGSVSPSVPRKCQCFLLHRCGRSPTVPWLCGVVSAGEKPQIPFSLEEAYFFLLFFFSG